MNYSTGRAFRIVRWIVRIAFVVIFLHVANGRIEVSPLFLKAVSLLLGAISASMLCMALSSPDVRAKYPEDKWYAGGVLLFAAAIGSRSMHYSATFAFMIMSMLLWWRAERVKQRQTSGLNDVPDEAASAR